MGFRVGDEVKVIQAALGATGANGSVGILVDYYAKTTGGLISSSRFKIDIEGTIWAIGDNPVLKLISKGSGKLIGDKASSTYGQAIKVFMNSGVHGGRIEASHEASDKRKMEFGYSGQCDKMTAFKKALLYLLDHSDIKQDLVGQEVKAEIEGKIYKVKVIERG